MFTEAASGHTELPVLPWPKWIITNDSNSPCEGKLLEVLARVSLTISRRQWELADIQTIHLTFSFTGAAQPDWNTAPSYYSLSTCSLHRAGLGRASRSAKSVFKGSRCSQHFPFRPKIDFWAKIESTFLDETKRNVMKNLHTVQILEAYCIFSGSFVSEKRTTDSTLEAKSELFDFSTFIYQASPDPVL